MADNVDQKAGCSKSEPGREDGDGVSMLEVLEEEKQLEEDANAVLGDSDDKNCTYLMGTIPRQALYSCLTCIDPDQPPAGVCLACCLECHEGHDMIELYTKRDFRCDCGNKKFGNFKCKLSSIKDDFNEDNSYNQNFSGKYCTCARPYPDPDDTIEDEMIQCVICEDWYHGRHLGSEVPENENYDEMTCGECMSRCDFLLDYIVAADEIRLEKVDSDDVVNVEATPDKEKSTAEPVKTSTNGNEKAGTSQPAGEPSCLLAELRQRDIKKHKGAAFWPNKWRSKLCRCDSCKRLYEGLGVSFLLDEADSIKAYEERGRVKGGSQYESGMQALSSMDRTQQVEMLHGYNDMKSELTDYLKKFADNKKVVREEDIREFFQQLGSRKKQKTAGAPQYFCK